jgi:hypothetical protein
MFVSSAILGGIENFMLGLGTCLKLGILDNDRHPFLLFALAARAAAAVFCASSVDGWKRCCLRLIRRSEYTLLKQSCSIMFTNLRFIIVAKVS